MNAQDLTTEEKRSDHLDHEMEAMRGLGFQPAELDLRDFFGKPGRLAEKLKEYGLLWIRGGNVFVLQRAMRQSGFEKCIRDLLESERLVYAGFSGAAAQLHRITVPNTPNLKLSKRR
jgi:dipeptidase E